MHATPETHDAIVALVRETYRRLSTPGSDPGSLFMHPDMTIAGSGQGELFYRADDIAALAAAAASWGFPWTADDIRVWQEGDVAWAQVLGSIRTHRGGVEDVVPYWTTGVFARDADGWRWRYWGGAEPQAEPRV